MDIGNNPRVGELRLLDCIKIVLSRCGPSQPESLSLAIIKLLANIPTPEIAPRLFAYPKHLRPTNPKSIVAKALANSEINEELIETIQVLCEISDPFAVECVHRVCDLLKSQAVFDELAPALLSTVESPDYVVDSGFLAGLIDSFAEERKGLAKSKQEREDAGGLRETLEKRKGKIRGLLSGRFRDLFDDQLRREQELRRDYSRKRDLSHLLWKSLSGVVGRHRPVFDENQFVFTEAIKTFVESRVSRDEAISTYVLYANKLSLETQSLLWRSLFSTPTTTTTKSLDPLSFSVGDLLACVRYRWLIFEDLDRFSDPLPDSALSRLSECSSIIAESEGGMDENRDEMSLVLIDKILVYVAKTVSPIPNELLLICETLSAHYFRRPREDVDRFMGLCIEALKKSWSVLDLVLGMMCMNEQSIQSCFRTRIDDKMLFRVLVVGRSNYENKIERIIEFYDGFKARIPLVLMFDDLIDSLNSIPAQLAGNSLSFLVCNDSDLLSKAIDCLIAKYAAIDESTKIGRERRYTDETNSLFRSTSICLKSIIESFGNPICSELIFGTFAFIVENGFRNPLSEVRDDFLRVASILVDKASGEDRDNLVEFLDSRFSQLPKSSSCDQVRLNIVILIGTVARYLRYDESKVLSVIDQLLEILNSTSSRFVQMAIANCLGRLVPQLETDLSARIESLTKRLYSKETQNSKRGAAYGIAGIGQGLGVVRLSNLPLLKQWQSMISDEGKKTGLRTKEGALLGFGAMFDLIGGSSFEMFVIPVIPAILACLSDSEASIRSAAGQCSRSMMNSLSSKAVRLVLPSLLDAVESPQWRTKRGAVECLGMMASGSPDHLYEWLPQIVPKLIEVLLSATQIQLLDSAQKSLLSLGSVTKNAYMRTMIPLVISAIQDPANRLLACMQRLRQMAGNDRDILDLASTSLVVPVLERGLNDRLAGMRQQTAEASIHLFTNAPVDGIAPYADVMIDHCRKHLTDPSPEVRNRIARLMAVIVSKTSKKADAHANWFIEQMSISPESGGSAVQKIGAAHGLCELSLCLGTEYLHKRAQELLELIKQTSSIQYAALVFFDFLAVKSPELFKSYIGQMLVTVLDLIGSESEDIREASSSLGKRLVDTLSYDLGSINLLINEIELHLFAENWRVRGQSVILLGDLLFKTSEANEDGKKLEQGYGVLKKRIGPQNTDRILSELFISSNDIVSGNAQKSAHIWKVLSPSHGSAAVMNSLLPSILAKVKQNLDSDNAEIQFMMGKSIGELFRLIGADYRAFSVILDDLSREVLQKHDRPNVHAGVLRGIAWILEQSSMIRDQISQQPDSIVELLVDGMKSESEQVRSCLSPITLQLPKLIGSRRTAEILLICLNRIPSNHPPFADQDVFAGETFYRRSVSSVVQDLDPQTTQHLLTCLLADHDSIQKFQSALVCYTDTICRCSDQRVVSGNLGEIISLFVCSIKSDEADNQRVFSRIAECLDCICSRTGTQANQVAEKLVQLCCLDQQAERDATKVLTAFVSESSSYFPINEQVKMTANDRTLELILSQALKLSTNAEKADLSYQLIEAIVSKLKIDEYVQFVRTLSRCWGDVIRPFISRTLLNKHSAIIPGFSIPSQGIKHLAPLFKHIIINTVDEEPKLSCASILLLLIPYIDVSSAKHSILAIIGPIIRLIGQKCSAQLHTEMLLVLVSCVYHEDLRTVVKFFAAQLQPAFLRAINLASTLSVALIAAQGLKYLGLLGPRQEIAIHAVSCGLAGVAPSETPVGSDLPTPSYEENSEEILKTLLYAFEVFELNKQPIADSARVKDLLAMVEQVARSREICLNPTDQIEQHPSLSVPCSDFASLCGLLEASLFVSESRTDRCLDWVEKRLDCGSKSNESPDSMKKSLSGLCLLVKNRPDLFGGQSELGLKTGKVLEKLMDDDGARDLNQWTLRVSAFLSIARNDQKLLRKTMESALDKAPLIAVHFANHLISTGGQNRKIGVEFVLRSCRSGRSGEARDLADLVLANFIGKSSCPFKQRVIELANELGSDFADGDFSWVKRLQKIRVDGLRPVSKLGRELIGARITSDGDLDGYSICLLV